MRGSAAAFLLFAAWVATIAATAAFAARQLAVSSDLRLFLPSAHTAEERLLLEGLGEGPAARVLVVALAGASPAELANASRTLVTELRGDSAFLFVANGEMALDEFPDELLPYRFLLSPTLDSRRFDAELLTASLAARARDLSSPAGVFLEPWLARDPTLEVLSVLRRWQPTHEPRREFDMWFDATAERALLIAETRAPAFDPSGQRAALAKLDAALAAANVEGVRMNVSGAGQFSVLMEQRTRAEAQRLGIAGTLGMLLLLTIAYRSIGSVLLSVLSLASAGLAGLAAVGALFGSVHGITLAFGFTLIGVAQDYPLHILSHRRADRAPRDVARALWPTLATGVAGTCIAYLTFLVSGVTGLQQLACFTVTGLAVAGLASRFVLPALMGDAKHDYGDSPALTRASRAIVNLPRPAWAAGALAAICIGVVALAPRSLWNNDLASLTPVPADLLAADRDLRAQLGTADLRYMLVVDAPDDDSALTRLEALEPTLEALVERGTVASFDHAARYLPSAATQRVRQSSLPDVESLLGALSAAAAATPFRADAFKPFVDDVERARSLAPLTLEQLRAAGFGARIDVLLRGDAGSRAALVTFSGVRDVAPLRALAESAGATLLDLRRTSESLVARQREQLLRSLAIAAVLLVGVVALALRSSARVLRVLAPMALATLVVVAALQALAVPLTLFHLISLILVAGLGLDYALFFEHAASDAKERNRALHAVLVCSLSTLLVFTLLATSSLPVLRAIGLPVAIGVVANFVLALLLARGRNPNAVRIP
jgi:predicted exporter